MTTWKLVRLNFNRNPVHFGETGIGLENTTERVHSDTLFSAIVSSYARIFGKDAVEALFDRFNNGELPFRLSSSFLYQQREGQRIDYLPKPIATPPHYPSADLSFAKGWRKLNYLPLSVWQRWYQQGGFDGSDVTTLENYTRNAESVAEGNSALSVAGTFAYGDAFKESTLPKVAIDRTTRATNFYHTKFIQYAEQAGLYFLVAFSQADESLMNELKASLLFLGEEGIGGERSSGAGRFVPSWENLPENWQALLNADSTTHHSLISLFWAKPESEQFQRVVQSLASDTMLSTQYTLKARGGWIASPSGRQRRRQVVSMMTEGSVLPKSVFDSPPMGELANVTPPNFYRHNRHYIYRSGVSVSLPVALEV